MVVLVYVDSVDVALSRTGWHSFVGNLSGFPKKVATDADEFEPSRTALAAP